MDSYSDPLSVDTGCVSLDLGFAGRALRSLLFVDGWMASPFLK